MDSRLTVVDVTGSTNDDLLEAGKQGAPHGTGLAARAQTAGRGRRGHKWDSTAGNLLLSIVLRPCVNPAKYSGLAAVSGLAVLEALEMQGLANEIDLKWPNDLVLSGRKVCGILAEALPGPEGSLWVVVGIGINVCQRREDFLPELRETAASLSMIAGAEIDRAALETAFLEELEALRRELPQETAERRQEYGAACLNLGHRVRVLRPGGEREALAVSLTPDYGLAVRYDDGTEEVLRSGEVSVRGLYGYTDKE